MFFLTLFYVPIPAFRCKFSDGKFFLQNPAVAPFGRSASFIKITFQFFEAFRYNLGQKSVFVDLVIR
jgi:hypothetical protein